MKLLVVQNDEDTQLVRNDEFPVNFTCAAVVPGNNKTERKTFRLNCFVHMLKVVP